MPFFCAILDKFCSAIAMQNTQDEQGREIILVDQYYTDISCILKTIQRRIILEN